MITPTAVDLFSGAGGTTQGLHDAGFAVVVAIENDPDAAQTYRANHAVTELLTRDVARVQAPALARRLRARGVRLDLLTACPPCQPFSTLGTGDVGDRRNGLVETVARFAAELAPSAILVENVPGLQRQPVYRRLVARLARNYSLAEYIVQAADFGIPQKRRRMIVLGIDKHMGVAPPADLLEALPLDFDVSPTTAGDSLALARDLTEDDDPVHRARLPQPKTLARILAMAQGGGRKQLPPELQLACHARLERSDATSIYGRIDPALPSPTMTTRCTTPSCGRFVHPTENRGLTLREAALLQTFPLAYQFSGPHGAIERQIGNAVPPRLAEALGLVVLRLIRSGRAQQAPAASVGQAA